MANNLELLHEGFKNEVGELDSFLQHSDEYMLKSKRVKFENMLKDIISNLDGLCDSLYEEFENDDAGAVEELRNEHAIMLQLLEQYVPQEDRTYIKLKYKIEIGGGF